MLSNFSVTFNVPTVRTFRRSPHGLRFVFKFLFPIDDEWEGLDVAAVDFKKCQILPGGGGYCSCRLVEFPREPKPPSMFNDCITTKEDGR